MPVLVSTTPHGPLAKARPTHTFVLVYILFYTTPTIGNRYCVPYLLDVRPSGIELVPHNSIGFRW
ncbi:hypothetical protein K458DRAFT_35197 [Lentithecium fluviatile CBS 122367]|uniref:Uncharacterized protein n=1 Tax=Lentithecium fluviatile CBS 122367 TaxID=1168545 RepID=A0A6G1J0N1_9PLEO|nr:hypothetical protein K458DRAFT_35197 [Lentithecium fluviatile CBS 122367]